MYSVKPINDSEEHSSRPRVYISGNADLLIKAIACRLPEVTLREASDYDYIQAFEGLGEPFTLQGPFYPTVGGAWERDCAFVKRLNRDIRLDSCADILFAIIDGPECTEAVEDILRTYRTPGSPFQGERPIGLAYGPDVTMSARYNVRSVERFAHFVYDCGDVASAFRKFWSDYYNWRSKRQKLTRKLWSDPATAAVLRAELKADQHKFSSLQ